MAYNYGIYVRKLVKVKLFKVKSDNKIFNIINLSITVQKVLKHLHERIFLET